jgi:hypothetical protein
MRGQESNSLGPSSSSCPYSQTARKKGSAKFAPYTCGWHHADAGQASSEEGTLYEHLPHQDPFGHRRF